MNRLERRVDAIDPRLSITLRLLKKKLKHDPTHDVIRRFVGPGQSVADIGANRGVYTWLLSRRVGADGRVYSIEPFPANVTRLTTLARCRRNITVHPIAVSNSVGEATLRVPTYHRMQLDALGTLRSTVAHGFVPIKVEKSTLDDLIDPNANKLDFIKCDVEGHEDEVVGGAWRTITQNRPVMVIEIEQRHRTAPVSDLIERVIAVGYDCFFLDVNGLHPYAKFDIEQHQLKYLTAEFVPYSMPHGYVGNFVFVPKPG